MVKEVEYKFLVTPEWKNHCDMDYDLITQGYLTDSKYLQARIRIIEPSNNATIAVKGPRKMHTRDEYEYQIPFEDAQEMLTLCPIKLTKKRYYIDAGDGMTWEIDEYQGVNEGLVVAEIEVPSESTTFAKPGWVVKDITDDKQYTNSFLAVHRIKGEEKI